MRQHFMKKWMAVLLSLAMILACAAASAETVTDQVTGDRETIWNIPGIPDSLKPLLDPVLSLFFIPMIPLQEPGMAAPEATPAPQETADPTSWKTLADVLALPTESREATWDDEYYILIIRYAGTEWMMKAAFSSEQREAVSAVDFMAEDRNEQINAIIGPCPILKVVDLRTLALPQEELDRWIGKTGQDLLDAGWEYNGYHSDETGIHVCMVNGEFQYRISFAEEMKMTGSFGDQPENMPSAMITGITFDGKSYRFNEKEYFADP